VTAGTPTLFSTFAGELLKIRTSRAPRRNLILGTVLAIALSALLSYFVTATFDQWNATEQADFDPILYPLSGSLLTAIFFIAVGVNIAASEYNSGMIRLTFTVTPKRSRVLFAKTLAVSTVMWIFGLLSTVGMIAVGNLMFHLGDMPTVSFGDGDLWRTAGMLVLLNPVFPIIAMLFAFVFRNTAGAICAALAMVFAPGILGGLLPEWWQKHIVSLLPGPATDSLAIGHLTGSSTYLDPWWAALVVAVWLVGSLMAVNVLLNKRDV
jgi:ABC-2 type transport system permease protein